MRNLVYRADGKRINVTRTVGSLFVCSNGCCCGRTEEGYPAVPGALYHNEWERRGLRNRVHLTIGGCLGPCALANVALLLFNGRALWFHSLNSEPLVLTLYDYIDQLLQTDGHLPPPPELAPYQFTASTWQDRPDGLPVEDRHLRRQPVPALRPQPFAEPPSCPTPPAAWTAADITPDRLVANMDSTAALPRKNGELVFEAPWEGRAFGMAVALHEQQRYAWDEFRDGLIAQIAAAEARNEPSTYYERWLDSFEALLVQKGVLTQDEIDSRTDEFEFGVRDEVY